MSDKLPTAYASFMFELMVKIDEYLATDQSWDKPDIQSSAGNINIILKHNSGMELEIIFEIDQSGINIKISSTGESDDLWSRGLINVVNEFNQTVQSRQSGDNAATALLHIPECSKLLDNSYVEQIPHLIRALLAMPQIVPGTWLSASICDEESTNHVKLNHVNGTTYQVRFTIINSGLHIETFQSYGNISQTARMSLTTAIETFVEKYSKHESDCDVTPSVPTSVPITNILTGLSAIGEYISQLTIRLMVFRDSHPRWKRFLSNVDGCDSKIGMINIDGNTFFATVSVRNGELKLHLDIDNNLPDYPEIKKIIDECILIFYSKYDQYDDEKMADARTLFAVNLVEKIKNYISDRPYWAEPMIIPCNATVKISIRYDNEGINGDACILINQEPMGVSIGFDFVGDVSNEDRNRIIQELRALVA